VSVIGYCLAALTAAAQEPSGSPAVQLIVYRPEVKGDVIRNGTTKSVEMLLHQGKWGRIQREIRAIKGSQFSIRPLQPGEVRPRNGLDGLVVAPTFLPGDHDIRISIDPVVGYTEFLNLKILDPVVVSVGLDWRVIADREGVRATVFRGKVKDSWDCFHALGSSLNISEALAPDGSWPWPAGDRLLCDVELEGSDGEGLVTRRVTEAGKPVIAFVREVLAGNP
jgi:hypothetical protein